MINIKATKAKSFDEIKVGEQFVLAQEPDSAIFQRTHERVGTEFNEEKGNILLRSNALLFYRPTPSSPAYQLETAYIQPELAVYPVTINSVTIVATPI